MAILGGMDTGDMEKDFESQTICGPRTITGDMRLKHRELQALVKAQLPFRDIFKKNDCDLLYRFLISSDMNVGVAAVALQEYNSWREKSNINSVLEEFVEDWGDMPRFSGVDRDGYPVVYNTPRSDVMLNLLKVKPKETMIHRHIIAMERARYLCKKYNADRYFYVLDLTHVTMSGITQVVSFIKETTAYDQKYYPETMRRMIICNGGWVISAAWKGIKAFIDPQTQKKIAFLSGPPSVKLLSEYVETKQIPKIYGGEGVEEDLDATFKLLAELLSKARVHSSPARKFKEEGLEVSTSASATMVASASSQHLVEPETSISSCARVKISDLVSVSKPLQEEIGEPGGIFFQLERLGDSFSIHLACGSDGAQTARINGTVVGRMEGGIIFQGDTDVVMFYIQKEAGHLIHAHQMLVTPKKQVALILRKAVFGQEVSVFDVQGSRNVVSSTDMSGSYEGLKVHRFTVNQFPGSTDKDDWHFWRNRIAGRVGEEFLAWKQGQVVEVSERMFSVPGCTPESIIALVLALHSFW